MHRWIDGHLDLAYIALSGRDIRRPCDDPAQGCVSLPALRSAGIDLVFATIFTEAGLDPARGAWGYSTSDDLDAADRAGLRQLELYEQLESEGELSIVRSATDLERQAPLPKIVILMECADPIRSPGNVATWHRRGLRIVGLAWHPGSRYAPGNSIKGPLTPLGREMITALDELGIIHDVSHLSDAAMDELLELARGPVIASHSNCRALQGEAANQRHLRDESIRAIGRRGGVVGLNLYGKFLVPGPGGFGEGRRATIDDCIRHVEHVCEVLGHRGGIGLGSDADGGFGPGGLPEGLDHPSRWGAIVAALRGRGWSAGDIDGFTRGNWDRFLRRSLRPAPSAAAEELHLAIENRPRERAGGE